MTEKTRLVCPDCNAVNQFPADRLMAQPKCGKCKSILLIDKPITATAQSLGSHIANSGLPVLVDFWAPWCGPCVGFAPTFEAFAAEYKQSIRSLKLDTEANQEVGARYNIRSIPTLALFQGGNEVDRVSGALNAAQLREWVQQRIKEPLIKT